MCNIFKSKNNSIEDLAELKAKYEELLSYIKCLKLSDLTDVSGTLSPLLGDTLTFTGVVWNSVKGKYNVPAQEEESLDEPSTLDYEITVTPLYTQRGFPIAKIKINNLPEVIIRESPKYEEITMEELTDALHDSELTVGRIYRVTDYIPFIPYGSRLQRSGHTFDLLFKALNNYTLDTKAVAIPHWGENYKYYGMEKWEIIFDFEKQAIVYMKDQFGNEAPYDFKNILYKGTNNTLYYTFDNNGLDASNSSEKMVSNNKILNIDATSRFSIPRIQASASQKSTNNTIYRFGNIGKGSCYNTLYESGTIGNNSSHNTIVGLTYVGNNCNYNTTYKNASIPDDVCYYTQPIVNMIEVEYTHLNEREDELIDGVVTLWIKADRNTTLKWFFEPLESQAATSGVIQYSSPNIPVKKFLTWLGFDESNFDYQTIFGYTEEFLNQKGQIITINNAIE